MPKLKIIIKVICASSIAMILSVIIVFSIGSLGVEVRSEKGNSDLEVGKVYSADEIEERSRRALDKINEKISEDKERNEGILIDEARGKAAFFIWIPWFVVALAFRFTKISQAILLVVPPAILSFFGVFTVVELILFFLASYASSFLVKTRAR